MNLPTQNIEPVIAQPAGAETAVLVHKGYGTFGVSPAMLEGAVLAVRDGEQKARSSGKIQTFEISRQGHRQMLVIGRVYVVPPAVADDVKDFPTALLYGAMVNRLNPNDIIDVQCQQIGGSEFDEYSTADMKVIKDKLFKNEDGSYDVLVFFTPAWLTNREQTFFRFTKDEAKLKTLVRQLLFQAYFNPALSSMWNLLVERTDNLNISLVDPHITFPHLVEGVREEDGMNRSYPAMDRVKQAGTKIPKVAFSVANLASIQEDVLEGGELEVLDEMKKDLEGHIKGDITPMPDVAKTNVASAKIAAKHSWADGKCDYCGTKWSVQGQDKECSVGPGRKSSPASGSGKTAGACSCSESAYVTERGHRVCKNCGKGAPAPEKKGCDSDAKTALPWLHPTDEKGPEFMQEEAKKAAAKVTCPSCAGSGEGKGAGNCRMCGGSGFVQDTKKAAYGMHDCPDCGKTVSSGHHSSRCEACKRLHDEDIKDTKQAAHNGKTADRHEEKEINGHQYTVDTWEERDRLHISLTDSCCDKELLDLWDDDARSAIEDGFIDPRKLLDSTIEYARELGLLGKDDPKEAAGGPQSAKMPDGSAEDNDAMDYHQKALEAIENDDNIIYDVASEHGQIVGNVKHMSWFEDEVANALMEYDSLPEETTASGYDAQPVTSDVNDMGINNPVPLAAAKSVTGKLDVADPEDLNTEIAQNKCTHCDKKFPSPEALAEHLQEDADKQNKTLKTGGDIIPATADEALGYKTEEIGPAPIVGEEGSTLDAAKAKPTEPAQKTEAQTEEKAEEWEKPWEKDVEAAFAPKTGGFSYYIPGQVLQQFYPEIQHEIVDSPNTTNHPMIEDIDLVASVEAALDNKTGYMTGMFTADTHDTNISTSPAAGAGIGRDGKPQILEGAPLRKENDIRGYGFSEEYYKQYDQIPGAYLGMVASLKKELKGKTASKEEEVAEFQDFLKRVMAEIAAAFIAAYKCTQRAPMNMVPGVGKINLEAAEMGNVTSNISIGMASRVRKLVGEFNDSDMKSSINQASAQAAVWNGDKATGFCYEVFVRCEEIDTDTCELTYSFITGTKGDN
jgi:hypothetical protein